MGTSRKTVQRLIVTTVSILLIGAIVNVVVAWSCAVWLPIGIDSTYENGRSRTPDGLVWLTSRRTSATGVRVTSKVYPGFATGMWHGPSERLIAEHWGRIAYPDIEFTQEAVQFGLSYALVDEAHGWPVHSLWCTCEYDSRSLPPAKAKAEISGGIWLQEQNNQLAIEVLGLGRALPYFPLLPGFIINTLFYATILLGLICGPLIARRVVRRQNGHCLYCGYDLRGGSAGRCPECGSVSAHCIG